MIDGGVFLGRNPTNGVSLTEEELLGVMDRYGVGISLVHSYQGIFRDVDAANSELVELAGRHPTRIVPIACVSLQRWEDRSGGEKLDRLKKAGVKVIGFFKKPSYHEVLLDSFSMRSLVEAASRRNFVLQFGIENVADLSAVARLCGGLTSPVLVRWMSGRGYQALSEMITIAGQCRHFYFDVGTLTCLGHIAHLAQAIGSERLFFSSAFPETYLFASHFLLRASGLSEKDLRRILSGTLETVLGIKDPVSPKGEGSLRSQWQKFARMPKCDTHWHSDHWNMLEPCADPESHAAVFEALNYRSVCLSSVSALNGDTAEGNKNNFELVRNDPMRFGLVVVDPLRPALSVTEIEKYAKDPRCVGIKTIQDLYGLSLDADDYRPILKAAARHHLTVMAHLGGVGEAARRDPGNRFVGVHATYARAAHLTEIPNLYFDLATSDPDAGGSRLHDFIVKAGANKILFGSDGHPIHPAWTLGKLASLGLDDKVIKKILCENAFEAFPKMKKERKGGPR